MDLDKINRWLTMVGNIAVLAGILFLVVEIQQNTNMMQAQTRDSMTEKLSNWYNQLGIDETAAGILYIGNNSETPRQEFENISDFERWRYLINSLFRLWENEFYQYKMGLFDEAEFQPRSGVWLRSLNSPGLKSHWNRTRNGYSPEFVEFVENMILNAKTDTNTTGVR